MNILDFLKDKRVNGGLSGFVQGLGAESPETGIGNALGNVIGSRVRGAFDGGGETEVEPPKLDSQNLLATALSKRDEALPTNQRNVFASESVPQANPSSFSPFLNQLSGKGMDEPTVLPNTGLAMPVNLPERPRVVPEKKNNFSPFEVATNQLNEAVNAPVENQDKGLKGWLKEFVSNVSAGMRNAQASNPNGDFLSNLGSSLGTGIGGGTVNRSMNEQRNYDTNLKKAYQNYGIQKGIEDDRIAQDYRTAQVEAVKMKPVIDQQKANTAEYKAKADALYRQDRLILDRDRAEQNDRYRQEVIRIGDAKLEQGDERIKILYEGLKDKDLDRETKEKIAQIFANSRIDSAKIMANASIQNTNTREAGANYRNERNLSENRAKFNQLLAERQQALQLGDANKVKEIDIKIANGKAKAKAAGLTDEDIEKIFGN